MTREPEGPSPEITAPWTGWSSATGSDDLPREPESQERWVYTRNAKADVIDLDAWEIWCGEEFVAGVPVEPIAQKIVALHNASVSQPQDGGEWRDWKKLLATANETTRALTAENARLREERDRLVNPSEPEDFWQRACENCGHFAWECWICREDGPLPNDADVTGYFHPAHDCEYTCRMCTAEARVVALTAALRRIHGLTSGATVGTITDKVCYIAETALKQEAPQ